MEVFKCELALCSSVKLINPMPCEFGEKLHEFHFFFCHISLLILFVDFVKCGYFRNLFLFSCFHWLPLGLFIFLLCVHSHVLSPLSSVFIFNYKSFAVYFGVSFVELKQIWFFDTKFDSQCWMCENSSPLPLISESFSSYKFFLSYSGSIYYRKLLQSLYFMNISNLLLYSLFIKLCDKNEEKWVQHWLWSQCLLGSWNPSHR